MRYKLLGKSGLKVSEVALGTMTFGEEWGWGASKEESRQIFDAFAEAGGNFIDTANRYTEGTSEKYLADFMGSNRDHFVLATKYTLFIRRDDPNAAGNHRKSMVQALEGSLKRLKTDYLDLYWVHAWDPMTPIEETMRALDDMVRAGKVLYVGVSDTPAWVIARANTMAELRGWSQFVGIQVPYSLVRRDVERTILPMAHSMDIGVTVWGTLGNGVLSGKYTRQEGDSDGRAALWNQLTPRNLEIARAVDAAADDVGCSPAQVALSWLQQQPGVVIPIIGAKSAAQLKDNLGCVDVTLTAEQMQRLHEVSKIDLGFPYGFLAEEEIKDMVYAGTFSKIDNHRA